MDKKLCATLNGRTYCLLQDADWEAFKREFKALEAVRGPLVMDRKKQCNNSSGVPGVTFCKRSGKWRVTLKGTFLGYFETKDDAVQARRRAEAVHDWCKHYKPQ